MHFIRENSPSSKMKPCHTFFLETSRVHHLRIVGVHATQPSNLQLLYVPLRPDFLPFSFHVELALGLLLRQSALTTMERWGSGARWHRPSSPTVWERLETRHNNLLQEPSISGDFCWPLAIDFDSLQYLDSRTSSKLCDFQIESNSVQSYSDSTTERTTQAVPRRAGKLYLEYCRSFYLSWRWVINRVGHFDLWRVEDQFSRHEVIMLITQRSWVWPGSLLAIIAMSFFFFRFSCLFMTTCM